MKKEGQNEKRIPEAVFDYAFLGAEGERETVTVLVTRDTSTHMLFAHVPGTGFAHKHGAQEFLKDIQRLRRWVILKCDGKPALRSVHKEIKRCGKVLPSLRIQVKGTTKPTRRPNGRPKLKEHT